MSQTLQLELDGPTLVFGGPYSNLQATSAILEEARRLAIPPERIICTGDLVAYCAEPAATTELVRQSAIHVVMGNCDERLAQGAEDCGCGFPSGSLCERLASDWFSHALRQVPPAARDWLSGLPRRIDLRISGKRLAVIHGSVSQINEFVFASTPAEQKLREMDLAGTDGVIGGHCGIPFTQVLGGRLWHNAGVIGMPANDGTPRGWYSVLTPVRSGLRIERLPLSYDHTSAAEAMRRAGLPQDYTDALVSGLWPCDSILPAREAGLKGVRLAPTSLHWTNAEPALEEPAPGVAAA